MQSKLIVTASVLLAGCGTIDDPIGSAEDAYTVIDRYERSFSWNAPPCDLYLETRTTDEGARVVEYRALVGADELTLLYKIAADEPLPVRAEVYEGQDRLLASAFDARQMRIEDGAGGTLEISGYTGLEHETTVTGTLAGASPSALALIGCALPIRTTLGAVPAFLQNRDGGRLPDDPDVAQASEETPPILDWASDTSILGSVLLLSACTSQDGWRCPCLAWSDVVVGDVDGWCP